MRVLAVVLGCAFVPFVLAYGCSSTPDPVQPAVDSGKADAKLDAKTDGTVLVDGAPLDGDASDLDGPPPVEGDGDLFDGGPPPDGARVEQTIGAAGGTISGAPGSPLAGVVLEVPAGALSTDVIFALDIGAGTPPSGTLVSPVVKVGPDGTLFAKPARLTLPWTGAGSVDLAMVSRIGLSWSSLIDPSGNSAGKTLTASMARASGAAVVALDLGSTMPKIALASPNDAGAGATIFLEGSGFGAAPIWRAGADGGADFVSNVTIGGTTAKTLAWEDGTITIQGTTTGAIVVTTPGGSSSAP